MSHDYPHFTAKGGRCCDDVDYEEVFRTDPGITWLVPLASRPVSLTKRARGVTLKVFARRVIMRAEAPPPTPDGELDPTLPVLGELPPGGAWTTLHCPACPIAVNAPAGQYRIEHRPVGHALIVTGAHRNA